MKIKNIVAVFVGILVLVGSFTLGSRLFKGTDSQKPQVENKQKAVVYKSPTCGCCVGFVAYLRDLDYKVEIVTTNDTAIKSENNIPTAMQSCHTSIIGDYFVEGHMPIEAINKLLADKPDIDGIALPGMPSGSPGMPGIKTEEWEIFAIKDGEISSFLKI